MITEYKVLRPEGYSSSGEFWELMGEKNVVSLVVEIYGERHEVECYTLERISSTLTMALGEQEPCVAEHNFILVPEVARLAVHQAIVFLVEKSFFKFSKPVEPARLDWYIDWIEDTFPTMPIADKNGLQN
jgi:hypothetical protein